MDSSPLLQLLFLLYTHTSFYDQHHQNTHPHFTSRWAWLICAWAWNTLTLTHPHEVCGTLVSLFTLAVNTLSIDLYYVFHTFDFSPCLCVNTFCRLFIISYFVILLCIFCLFHFHSQFCSFSFIILYLSFFTFSFHPIPVPISFSFIFSLSSPCQHSFLIKRRGCKM